MSGPPTSGWIFDQVVESFSRNGGDVCGRLQPDVVVTLAIAIQESSDSRSAAVPARFSSTRKR